MTEKFRLQKFCVFLPNLAEIEINEDGSEFEMCIRTAASA